MRADKWMKKKFQCNHYSTQAIQLTTQWNFTSFGVGEIYENFHFF
jgi:RimJ/RimL family protein N-acetyltransferase